MQALPFLLIFSLPIGVILGYRMGGWWHLAAPLVVFGIIPLLDLVMGRTLKNPLPEEETALSENKAFRYITWACAPIQVFMVFWGAYVFTQGSMGFLEKVLFIFALGTSSGAMGINVSHELIHRVNNKWEPSLGRVMLATVLYLHWSIEHVVGHHRMVATPEDPATSRLNESFWAFFPRTVIGGWKSAWDLEAKRLERKGQSPWGVRNRLFWFSLAQLLLVVLFWRLFGFWGVVFLVFQSLMAVFLLEIVNYIEHYGMLREKKEDGRFEPVRPYHSWNSSNKLTNLFLFNLQRHSDHHFRPGRRYQVLRHFEEAPQLPTGYAGMILLAAVPSLWFKTMNPKVGEHRSRLPKAEE